jgi:hypothetical protein
MTTLRECMKCHGVGYDSDGFRCPYCGNNEFLSPPSAEQRARDLLERLGVPDAQAYTCGDIAELANLIAERDMLDLAIERIAAHLPDEGVTRGVGKQGNVWYCFGEFGPTLRAALERWMVVVTAEEADRP